MKEHGPSSQQKIDAQVKIDTIGEGQVKGELGLANGVSSSIMETF
jgi:hypothetical protein